MTEGSESFFKRTLTRGMSILDSIADILLHDVALIRREAHLFLGWCLFLVGVFHFRTGKICDGNPVDYLSCTRPTAYHYYGALEITLIVLGVFLILLWFLRKRTK